MNRYGLKVSPDFISRRVTDWKRMRRSLCELRYVEVVPYIDGLFITDAGALMAYIRSMRGIWHLEPEALVEMEVWLEAEIRQKGGFSIQKASGVVLAR